MKSTLALLAVLTSLSSFAQTTGNGPGNNGLPGCVVDLQLFLNTAQVKKFQRDYDGVLQIKWEKSVPFMAAKVASEFGDFVPAPASVRSLKADYVVSKKITATRESFSEKKDQVLASFDLKLTNVHTQSIEASTTYGHDDYRVAKGWQVQRGPSPTYHTKDIREMLDAAAATCRK